MVTIDARHPTPNWVQATHIWKVIYINCVSHIQFYPRRSDPGSHTSFSLLHAFPHLGCFSSTKEPRSIQTIRMKLTSRKDQATTLL